MLNLYELNFNREYDDLSHYDECCSICVDHPGDANNKVN